MTAPFRTPSLSVQASVAASLAPWAGKPHPQSFADEIRETANQISADVSAGRKVVTEYGIFTPAEIAAAVHTDGGIIWPSSIGAPEFLYDARRDDAVLRRHAA